MFKFLKTRSGQIIVAVGVIICVLLSVVVIRATQTVKAIVPTEQIASGTVIKSDMVKETDVPVNTPKGYITDKKSVVGQKLKTTVQSDQLLYIGNIQTSLDSLNNTTTSKVPSDYIITTIDIPAARAVGGKIVPGNTVDIMGMPNSTTATTDSSQLDQNLGAMSQNSFGANGTKGYWVLSNVKILETNVSSGSSSTTTQTKSTTDTSSAKGSTTNSSNSSGSSDNAPSTYVVALSYSDYMKVRLAEKFLDLWMNIAPTQNQSKDPLYDQMKMDEIKPLQDAQAQTKDSTALKQYENSKKEAAKQESDSNN